jgi:hypothetical protein
VVDCARTLAAWLVRELVPAVRQAAALS